MLSKLVPVVGNVCESNLGLEEDLVNSIANEVDVIVNSAANTTFDERLCPSWCINYSFQLEISQLYTVIFSNFRYDVAIDINTRGACHLMSFAKKCQNLKLFLQVSTGMV